MPRSCSSIQRRSCQLTYQRCKQLLDSSCTCHPGGWFVSSLYLNSPVLLSVQNGITFVACFPLSLCQNCCRRLDLKPVNYFIQTLPQRPKVPPRREISSKTSNLMSAPIAPRTSTATPLGLLTSNVTVISTSPDIGGRSGNVMVIFGRRGADMDIESRSLSPKMGSTEEPGRDTLTGIRWVGYVPSSGKMSK